VPTAISKTTQLCKATHMAFKYPAAEALL